MRTHDTQWNEPTADLFGDDTQRSLARWNARRFAPAQVDRDWVADLAHEHRMRTLEIRFLERCRAEVAEQADKAPSDPQGFLSWYEGLEDNGPGQHDALFPWLAEKADLDQMRWFLTQEFSGETGFDDLLALTQMKLPVRAKLELARNYWDEMGRGRASGMHGPMLGALAQALDLSPTIEGTLPAPLALGNAMIAMAANRRYTWHSIGALGVIELTAPWRAALVNQGLKRLGVGRARRYYALHSAIDVRHSESWNAQAIRPLLEADPSCARYMAEGALIRLGWGARCFEAYRQRLWARDAKAAA